ncbi:MAG: hypothetical protein L6R41_007533 [Letrouitia leprolyta]|nr:MAG: hypothetical protein L6R41_007533 [Letrouitia leprolyta]
MRKWRLYSALERARPINVRLLNIRGRPFSDHTEPSQEDNPPSHRDRRSDITDQIQEHFQRHDLGRDIRPHAIDARDLAADPGPTVRPSTKFSSDELPANRAPLDARHLGARPLSNGPRITRESFGQRDEPSINGPRIVRTSDGPPGERGPRMLFRRDASDRQYQGSASNSQQNRIRGPPRKSQSSRPREGDPKERREGIESRGNDERDRDQDLEEDSDLTDEEIKYLETKDTSDYNDTSLEGRASKYTRSYKYKTYTPAAITMDSLQGMGPAFAFGERGMSETFGDKMIQVNKDQAEYDKRVNDLAQKWAEGEFCHFRSKQEREHTTKTVERNLAGTGDNARLDEEKEKEKMELMDTRMAEETEKLATRLLKGEYHIGPLGKGPTADLLERYTARNESYLSKDRQSFVEKISTLLPLKAAPPSKGPARK